MKQATRRFIKMRQGAEYVERVQNKPHPDAKIGQCEDNAKAEMLRTGNKVVVGWIITPYNKDIDASGIMHHFWNIDSEGNHYDTTPIDDKDYDYVWDDYFDECRMWSIENTPKWIQMPGCFKIKSDEILYNVGEGHGDFRWIAFSEKQFAISELLTKKLAIGSIK